MPKATPQNAGQQIPCDSAYAVPASLRQYAVVADAGERTELQGLLIQGLSQVVLGDGGPVITDALRFFWAA